jgi:CubicO group peptidase (beta-lactamase class C family)
MNRYCLGGLSLLVCSIVSMAGFGQEISMVKPEEVGLSSQRLERMDALIHRYIEQGKISGAVTLIARRGKIAHFTAAGYLDVNTGAKMSRDTLFRIKSMTKLITSVGVMFLYEEGRFALNDPVSKYIPEFKNMQVALKPAEGTKELPTVPAKNQITIRDLLRHTSGITYGIGYPYIAKEYEKRGLLKSADTLSNFIKKLAEMPLAFEPGTDWDYSYSTDVLGYLIEVLSGKPLDQYLKERIFVPLKMEDTDYSIPASKVGRLPNLYNYENGKLTVLEAAAASEHLKKPSMLWGGSGLVSTAGDYFRFLQMILNKGEREGLRLLSRKTVELMLCDHLNSIPNGFLDPGVGFGLGVAVVKNVGELGELSTPGRVWWAGYDNTSFFIDPREEMICILMTQMRPFGHLGLMNDFERLCTQAIID